MKKIISGILLVILLLSLTLTSAKADIPSFEGLTPEELREARDILNQMLAALPIDDSEIITETSRKAPARIGQIVECEADNWKYGTYKYQIQLVSLVRGEEALEQIKAYSSINKNVEPSTPDNEFVIAVYGVKIIETNDEDPKIEMNGAVISEAISADGMTYAKLLTIYAGENKCELYEGGKGEITIVYEVSKGDAPNVLFSTDESEAWISLAIPQ